MKRKRLEHAVHTFGHMFCGWQGIFEYPRLVELGNGVLIANILNLKCQFDGKEIESLSIVKAISHWFSQDCKTNNINIADLKRAELVVTLSFSLIDSEDRTTFSEIFSKESDKMHRCHFICKGIVETDEKIYETVYDRLREWPMGWPPKQG